MERFRYHEISFCLSFRFSFLINASDDYFGLQTKFPNRWIEGRSRHLLAFRGHVPFSEQRLLRPETVATPRTMAIAALHVRTQPGNIATWCGARLLCLVCFSLALAQPTSLPTTRIAEHLSNGPQRKAGSMRSGECLPPAPTLMLAVEHGYGR